MSSRKGNLMSSRPRRAGPVQVIAMKPPTKIQRIAKDVAVLKKNAKKEEFKWFDVNLVSTISTTPTVAFINSIPQGVNGSNFTGNQYCIKSIQLSGYVILEDATEHDELRIVLVRYKNANQVSPTYSNTGGNDGLYEEDSINAVRSMNNRHDFVIIKEWNVLLNQTNVNSRRIDLYKKINLVTTVQEGQDGNAATEIEQNSYFIMTMGNTALASDNSILTVTTRFRYTDN